jgi:hypothetical protein
MATTIKQIKLTQLVDTLNRSNVAKTQELNSEVMPTEFKATTDIEFFKDLLAGDFFVIEAPCGKKEYYTVMSVEPHVFEENLRVLSITRGMWVGLSGGSICVGTEFKG